MSDPKAEARGLLEYVDASPSPYHAVAETAQRLDALGFRSLRETDRWELESGGAYIARAGSLIAWFVPEGAAPDAGLRILGAHTDSPNLRVKPRPDVLRAGWRSLGMEVYGGALLNSWLDRDLGLSGRAFIRGENGPQERLFLIDRPLLRVPQLAIHLHREIHSEGLKLNPQEHMVPVWGLASGDRTGNERGFRDLLAEELDVRAKDIQGWDAMAHDLNPSRLIGEGEVFVSAPRLDNLASCFVGLRGLERAVAAGSGDEIAVLACFDHEEVGSQSSRGAAGSLLRDSLERIVLARGGDRETYLRSLARSICVSADMAHATHPNWIAKHDPDHHLLPNRGPVIKLNANLRYASEGSTEAFFQDLCERAGAPFQKWVNRTDLACGSTIGPVTAARLGIPTVDVGMAQLAMHSSREMCGAEDPAWMIDVLELFLRGEGAVGS